MLWLQQACPAPMENKRGWVTPAALPDEQKAAGDMAICIHQLPCGLQWAISQSPTVKQEFLGLENIPLNCWQVLTEDHSVLALFPQATVRERKSGGTTPGCSSLQIQVFK